MEMRHNTGFTLIELSIVLVIIGLIVGGVLVGRDLIQAAAVRSQVGQIEKYNSAVNTFRAKYNAVPGDMLASIAANYGLLQLNSGTPLAGDGDGNGVIESGGPSNQTCTGSSFNANQFCGEFPTFWRHLSDAKLVDGQFGTTGPSAINPANCMAPGIITNISQSIPAAKIGRGLSISIISGAGTNYYLLYPVSMIDGTGMYYMNQKTGLTPIEAQNIDAKMDDGQPETGLVLAASLNEPTSPGNGGVVSQAERIGLYPPSAATTSTLGKCVISSDGLGDLATDNYNLIPNTGGNDPSCAMAIRFQ
jgi:prepilin-type N-terminal cleavage/methylation domain-containing protein